MEINQNLGLVQSTYGSLLGNVGESVAAGHVERRPAILVCLHDVSTVFHQQFHTLQVPREHGLMDGCHACR